MHTKYYGDKTLVSFDLTKSLKSKEQADLFEPVPVPEFDDLGEVMAELDKAEQTLFKYKQMLEHVVRADEITDAITCGPMQQEHMTEYDSVPHYEDSSMDVLHAVRKNIEVQVLKFQRYCDDLQAHIDDMSQQLSDDEKYGTYDEQVRSLFYATR